MPLSTKEFADVLRILPPEQRTPELIDKAVAAKEAGTPLEQVWNTINRPLVGSKDALIPQLRHKHSPDEGFLRTTAEDLGASLTSPVSIATAALGAGAGVAGKAGKFGISNAARLTEMGLQLPFAAEGIKNATTADSPGQALGGVVEAGLATHGINKSFEHAFNPAAVKATYMAEHGLSARTPEPFSEASAMRTADDYAAMKHEPNNPDVQKSYNSLNSQIDEQHKFLVERAGVKLEPWTGEGEPYPGGAKDMQADVTKNNHLWFLPTDKHIVSDIPSDHPMVREIPGELLPNDKFRAVHDYMGHATDEKASFGPIGEQRAFNSHRDTLTPAAEGALASETKGQNSWVNFGEHLQNAEGVVPKKGEPGFVSPQARPFANQKAGLLPEFQPSPAELAQADALLAANDPTHAGVQPPQVPQTNPADPAFERAASAQTAATRASQSPLPSAAPQLQLSPELLADVNARHAQGGGSSTNLTAGKAVSAQDARYLLSPYEDRQLKLDHPPTPQELRNYVAKNEDLLSKPGHNLGTWFNGDGDKQHYLDVSIGENDLNKALDLGAQHKQLAIYDMLDGKDIPVGESSTLQQANSLTGAFQGDRTTGQFKEGNGGLADLLAGKIKPNAATAAAVVGPLASAGIDDSDPNDPHQQLKHYAKLGLDLAGAAGFGAAIRANAQSPQKAAAAKGAAYTLLDNNKGNWMKRMLVEGTPKEDLPKIRAASEKMLNTQLAKTASGMPNAKKLLAHFNTGTSEMGWYDDVHKELTGLFGKDAPLMANLLAATSSNSTVKSNTTLALKAYGYLKSGKDLDTLKPGEGFLPAVLMNIKKAAAGERLAGRKIDNFAQAIQGNPDAVVVDRWMMRAFGFDKDAPTPHQYDVIEHAVKDLAQRQGVTPRQMQAAIWFSVKNKAEAGKGRAATPDYGSLLKQKMAQQNLPL